jgi:hypothetical protein
MAPKHTHTHREREREREREGERKGEKNTKKTIIARRGGTQL